MGKKKVSIQSSEEVLKESEKIQSAADKSAAKSAVKKAVSGNIYVKASYNNTIITVTNPKGDVMAWASSGGMGFKGPKKATPFAASKIVETLVEKLNKSGLKDVIVYVNGIGGGRDSAIRSFMNHGYNILAINDVTPVAHNGPTRKKPRRV
ncbi:MAG: 30S ribosomal protein S11 [Candidatus Harrisonbacteria bacterium CG10_big_fil_rev_8_21_14_0_10_38_8]|uniref:Small ribosomal subunit protein uS11 n=1 Tax=Candidatus Harrisonbacteria bacterium CG10_big_fil_rev_8_21_14_0_10_38_8 TaxID=1974582 RepID=A0A2M6WJM6_9BACT|nr:MAG: 30S ribosomal protein S11 [Candidatus Harrisonbacteria bacterium CG10_big_fil_rev_8_21_14_0_10_38_8]